ncbi:MAG: DUF4893 domain-containing protein [Caulobacter sp.]|nr:DUF4893 domain-containing protein [Caulobacter sp.]
MMKTAFAALAALTLVACSPEPAQETSGPAAAAPPPVVADPGPAPTEAPPVAETEPGEDALWKALATAGDKDRLARLPDAWRRALDDADHLFGAHIDAMSLLLAPNGALAGNLQPPPGKYACRTIKIGGDPAYIVYGWFTCTVELTPGGDLILTKTTGSQRSRGLLFPDSDKRLVFLGAQAWGEDETDYPAYGANPERDQIGVVERVGTNRWRLVLPWPKQESKLDVLELKR